MKRVFELFCQMNVTLIKEVDFTFDETTNEYLKNKLLDELMRVFLPFKRAGDKYLIAYETSCKSDVCSQFMSSRYFCFVGDKTRNFCLVKFVLKDGTVNKISFCDAIFIPDRIEVNNLIEPPSDISLGSLPF